MHFVWSQLSIAAISALSSPFSLFTLSQKIKHNTSPTHQIIRLSIPVRERERREEIDSKCAFVNVITCLCHRSDWIGCIKRTHWNFYFIRSGAGLWPTVTGWIHAARSCTQSHTHTCTLSLTFLADLNGTHAPGKQDSTPPYINWMKGKDFFSVVACRKEGGKYMEKKNWVWMCWLELRPKAAEERAVRSHCAA